MKVKRMGLMGLIGLALMLAAGNGWSFGANPSDKALKKVFPALVRIYVVSETPSQGRIRRVRGAGSGAIISEDGYVVTNHHVAGNATRIVCNLSDQDEVEAELIGTDALSDIAVLKLKLDQRRDPNAPVPVAQWGDSDGVEVGDTVFALGSPGALSQSITQGIVANTRLIMPKGRGGAFNLDGENVGSVVRWIAHDAIIFGGNSGGPLVNKRGEIIGINEIGVASLGGAIPGNLARSIAEEIIANGHVTRSWTGLSVQPRLRSAEEARGVLVANVLDDTPASEAGLKAGDVIVRWNGVAVDCELPEQLPVVNQTMLSTPVGASCEVDLLRDGKAMTLVLKSEKRDVARSKPREVKSWGMAAFDLTRTMAIGRKRENTDGVLVGSLRPSGGSAEAKPALQRGDIITAVNGQAVRSVDELIEQTNAAHKDDSEARTPVLVAFDRKDAKLLTVVKVGREEDPQRPARARKPWPAAETQVISEDVAEALGMKGTKGVRITRVFPGRAAEKAGLKVGDLITHLDGESVDASRPEDSEVYAAMLRRYRVGGEADLSVIRGKDKMKITMKLEAPPEDVSRLKPFEEADFEFTVRDVAFADKDDEEAASSEVSGGALVTVVERGGWSDLAGLRSGDRILAFNGEDVKNVKHLRELVDAVKTDKPRRISAFLKRGIVTLFIEFEPDWK